MNKKHKTVAKFTSITLGCLILGSCVGCTQGRNEKVKLCTGMNQQGAVIEDRITYEASSGIIMSDKLKANTTLTKEKYPKVSDKDVQIIANEQVEVYKNAGMGVKYSNAVDGRTVVEELEIDYKKANMESLAKVKLINIKDGKVPTVLNIKDTVSLYEAAGLKCADQG